MPRIRNIITAVSFVALSAVSLAAAVQAISRGLPKALPSNVTVLMAALAAEDVASQPRWVKLKFAGRAQRELSDNVDWSAELARLDEAQRERLVENIAELARTSFDANLDEYFRLREGRRRRDFLDAQIKMITRWATLLDRARAPATSRWPAWPRCRHYSPEPASGIKGRLPRSSSGCGLFKRPWSIAWSKNSSAASVPTKADRSRWRAAGGRRQEAGGRRQAAGGRRQ